MLMLMLRLCPRGQVNLAVAKNYEGQGVVRGTVVSFDPAGTGSLAEVTTFVGSCGWGCERWGKPVSKGSSLANCRHI